MLDTNVLSEPTKGIPNERVSRRVLNNLQQIATSATVWNELLFGVFRLPISSRRTALENYIFQILAPAVPILPYNHAAAEWHAAERARLGRVGLTPPFVDGQIGAVARVNDLILVTANTADFQDFEGLQIEDWSR